jgi:GT2 family glycosyltransferase
MEQATGEVALFLGDDTPPASPDLLQRHIDLHTAHPEKSYAVLGRMDWDPAIRPSEFMHWLMSAGFQSAYDGLQPGPVSPVLHFITSHASTKRSLIVEAGGFDEDFPFYLEHVELGIRLERAGMVLDYHPEMLVYHNHPHTLASYLSRMEGVGKAARQLRERWPEETPWQVKGPERKWRLYPFVAPLSRVALRLPTGKRIRGRAWGIMMMAAYARGYRSG